VELAEGITPQDIKLFLTEADEQLQLLDEDIVRLEREPDNVKLLEGIFRASHTIKGSSAMIGHQRMSHLAHGMENVLDKVRKRSLSINSAVIDALLDGLDTLRILREELVTGEESSLDLQSKLDKLESLMNNNGNNSKIDAKSDTKAKLPADDRVCEQMEKTQTKDESGYQIKVVVNNKSTWISVRCFQVVQELSKIAEITKSNYSLAEIEAGNAGCILEVVAKTTKDEAFIRSALSSIPEVESISISPYPSQKPVAVLKEKTPGNEIAAGKKEDANLKQTIRVDVSRIDTLMEQIGELVINRNHISRIGKILAEKYQDDELIRSLSDSLSQTGKIVNVLQQDIMTIRMLPIELVFNTMPRMVRDLAKTTGKKIDFILEGQDTEVDRSVIEHLRDPLIHLLRNSVDHGIEAPEARIAAGKPETGTIRLSAHQEQDQIVVTVTDDGGGINPQAVKAAAIRKGLISAEAAAAMTDTELINLIMASGVSTATKVSEVSGRGVGLDIVKKNVEFLNGTISVESVLGEGSTFTLKLPLTLAIIPALLVSVDHTVSKQPCRS
jgi:two-component system chemotaxis sensor kinase CheA